MEVRRHQLDLMRLVSELEVTTVIAIHDLNLAAMYCDTVMVLDRGRAVAAGTPAKVLTPGLMQEITGVAAEVSSLVHGQPHIRFLA